MSFLLDLLGDAPPKLTLRKVTRKTNRAEILLYRHLSWLLERHGTLEGLAGAMQTYLDTTDAGNGNRIWLWYKVVKSPNRLTLVHLTNAGNIDRTVCIITQPTSPDQP